MCLIIVVIYFIALTVYAVMVTEYGSKNKFEKWFFHIDKYGNKSSGITPAFWVTLLFIDVCITVSVLK